MVAWFQARASFKTAPTASKNEAACFKSGQKHFENNHFGSLN